MARAALAYLDRFDSSVDNLRRVLLRRLRKAMQVSEREGAEQPDADRTKQHIEALLRRYQESGLLDDRRFAENQLLSLRGRGTSERGARQKLRQRGVPEPLVDEMLAAERERSLDDDDEPTELVAARAYVRRRRLGPYRKADVREEKRRKDLAALARAGFSFDIARRALTPLDAEDE